MKINTNLHLLDRLFRGVIGILVCGFVLFDGGLIDEVLLKALLFIFGMLNLISLTTGWCPVYHVVGVSTAQHEHSPNE